MSKISALQTQLERATGRRVAAGPTVAANTESTPETPQSAPKVSSRAGKVHIGAYLPEGFQTSLLAVRAQTREDVQTVLARALNDLFRSHNVPVIGQD